MGNSLLECAFLYGMLYSYCSSWNFTAVRCWYYNQRKWSFSTNIICAEYFEKL